MMILYKVQKKKKKLVSQFIKDEASETDDSDEVDIWGLLFIICEDESFNCDCFLDIFSSIASTYYNWNWTKWTEPSEWNSSNIHQQYAPTTTSTSF